MPQQCPHRNRLPLPVADRAIAELSGARIRALILHALAVCREVYTYDNLTVVSQLCVSRRQQRDCLRRRPRTPSVQMRETPTPGLSATV